MHIEAHSDSLTEVSVQHLPTIRWFKNNWMDLVFETNPKGECIEFSITYREVDDNFNIEWNGNQFFFMQNEGTLEQADNTLKETLYLLKNYGQHVPSEFMEFLT